MTDQPAKKRGGFFAAFRRVFGRGEEPASGAVEEEIAAPPAVHEAYAPQPQPEARAPAPPEVDNRAPPPGHAPSAVEPRWQPPPPAPAPETAAAPVVHVDAPPAAESAGFEPPPVAELPLPGESGSGEVLHAEVALGPVEAPRVEPRATFEAPTIEAEPVAEVRTSATPAVANAPPPVALRSEPPAATSIAPPPAPAGPVAPEPPSPPGRRPTWFQRLRQGLAKTSTNLAQNIAGIFTKRKLDADTLQELEDLLIQADLGVDTAARITDALAKGRHDKEVTTEEVRAVLAAEVERVLAPVAQPLLIARGEGVQVVLVVGVNGTGKTTTIGKLAQSLASQGSKVMMAAGDTFRAAAIDQLKIWGERTGSEVIARKVGADAAGLVFDALTQAREKDCDVLLVDTAGRLQNKQALMEELEKVIRVLRKIDTAAPHHVLLVLDATTGQNALNQVEVFKDKAGVTGLIMTKLDGTARGGILVAISARFGLPVHAIGVGEGVDDLSEFDAREFARAIALG